MNRVVRTLTRLSGLALFGTRREGVSLAVWVLLVVAFEALGPYARTDAMDALAVTALVSAMVTTLLVHRARPLAWLGPLAEGLTRFARGLQSLGLELGFDVREVPPLRRGVPKLFKLLLGASTLVFAAALAGQARWPEALRSLSVLSYTLYLFTVATLWSVLLGGVLLCGGVTLSALYAMAVGARQARNPGRATRWFAGFRERSYGLAFMCCLLIASFTMPPFVAAILMVTLWSLHALLLLAARVEFSIIWQEVRGEQRVLPWLATGLGLSSTLLFAMGAPILLAVGDELVWNSADVDGSMPLTRALGRLFTWAALFAFVTATYLSATLARQWLSFRRAMRSPRELRLVGIEDGVQRAQLVERLRRNGWRVRKGTKRDDLVLRVDTDASAPDSSFFAPSWPTVVSPEWLTSNEGLRKLERRWQMRQRRRLTRGLKSLFKAYSARNFQSGDGFWVSPNLWYSSSIEREVAGSSGDDPRELLPERRVGPPFTEIFTWTTRAHYCEVMRSLEVDLIFVETGVRFRAFRRVLGTLFEVYDVHGGEQRIEERHFTGLPGTSVVLVDFGLEANSPERTQLSERLAEKEYPEPEYEMLGRARVLHIFRDRGGDVEDSPAPEDVIWTPMSEWGPLLPT